MKPGDTGLMQTGGYDAQNTMKIRVMVTTPEITFYDVWPPHARRWDLTRRRTFAYLRCQSELLAQTTQWLGHEPFTDAEHTLHRQDLPMRAFSFSELEWDQPPVDPSLDYDAYTKALLACRDFDNSDVALPARKFWLCGPTKRGVGMHNSVLASAANGESFGEIELIWHAYRYFALQRPTVDASGIGLNWLGYKDKTPWYAVSGHANPAL
jgi:hypothetical protein